MAGNTLKLDLKDRKILYELDSNCRQSCTQIGKKVGLSTEVVNYRIKRLEESVITQYQIVANLSKLSILQFKICLALQHITSIQLNEIIEKLKINKSVKWIVSCNGNWDLIISLETDSLQSIDSLKDEVLNLFSGYIREKSVSILVEAFTYNRDYLLENKKANKKRIIMSGDKKISIDKVDMTILKQLSENARKSVINIAEEIGVSERVVNYRIKQMIKNEIILGFKIALNYNILGLLFYKAFIYLDEPDAIKIKRLVDYFELHKNIITHVKVLGNWDLEPEFEVSSEVDFNEILKDMKDKFSNIIKNIDVVTISKEHKFVYF